MSGIRRLCLAWGLAACSVTSVHAALLAIERDTGRLYDVDEASAALSLRASTGNLTFGDLAFAPDGSLWALTIGSNATLQRLDPNTGATLATLPLNQAVAEGALAIAPDGRAWVASVLDVVDPFLHSVNLQTGATTVVGQLGTIGTRDINGLAWRSDGRLVGLDRVSNALVLIDPADASLTTLAAVPGTVGGVGGLTLTNGAGYFVTSGPGGSSPGSNQLYVFDPFTGVSSVAGRLAPTVAGVGLAGLAAPVPEAPAWAAWTLGLAGLVLATKRRTRRR